MAVCPPNCSRMPWALSLRSISETASSVSGSKYSLSLVSKSVETVSGLLLMMMASWPRSRMAPTAWTQP